MDPQQRLFLQEAWHAMEDAGYAAAARAAAMGGLRRLCRRRLHPPALGGGTGRHRTPSSATPPRCFRPGSPTCSTSAGRPWLSTPRAPPRWSQCIWPARASAAGSARRPRGRRRGHDHAADAHLVQQDRDALADRKVRAVRRVGRWDRARRGRRRGRAEEAGPGAGRRRHRSRRHPAKRRQRRRQDERHHRPERRLARPNCWRRCTSAPASPRTTSTTSRPTARAPLSATRSRSRRSSRSSARTAIEVQPLRARLGEGNIGHTDAWRAGIAGLLKTLLRCAPGDCRRRPLPTANPKIDLADSPFRVVTEIADWEPGPSGRRTATVSGFGFSGTNCHVVVSEAPGRAVPDGDRAMRNGEMRTPLQRGGRRVEDG